jgi:transcriptional regulator with XRE-family HTH domain
MPTLKPKLAKEPNFPSRIRPETKLHVSLTRLSKQISQMTKETFGEYIRRLREERNLPLRKVAAQLDVDTSTLSKVERGERPMSIDYLKPLSQILKIDYKELQVRFLADSINANYGKLEYLEDGLDEVINQIKKNKK